MPFTSLHYVILFKNKSNGSQSFTGISDYPKENRAEFSDICIRFYAESSKLDPFYFAGQDNGYGVYVLQEPDNKFIYICVASMEMSDHSVEEFLYETKDAIEGFEGSSKDLREILKKKLLLFQESDKIMKASATMKEVKNSMIENIDKVLNRGKQMKNLFEATDDMEREATSFRSKSNRLFLKTLKKRIALILCLSTIICTIIGLVCVFIFFWVCFSSGATCFKPRKSEPSTAMLISLFQDY